MFGGCRLSVHDLLESKRGIAECSSFKCFQTGIWIYWIVLQVLKKKEKKQELLGEKIEFWQVFNFLGGFLYFVTFILCYFNSAWDIFSLLVEYVKIQQKTKLKLKVWHTFDVGVVVLNTGLGEKRPLEGEEQEEEGEEPDGEGTGSTELSDIKLLGRCK